MDVGVTAEIEGEEALGSEAWPVRRTGPAAAFNLIVPGAGIIALGSPWVGFAVGLLFTFCANFAIWAALVIPDEFTPWVRGLAIGFAGGTYVGAQLRFAQTVRNLHRRAAARQRDTALRVVRECLLRDDYAAALQALTPVRECAPRDLLVARRLAQVLTGLNEVNEALAAWQQVRALDRHRIYRDETRAAEQVLVRRRSVTP